jgi:hypothetical protein
MYRTFLLAFLILPLSGCLSASSPSEPSTGPAPTDPGPTGAEPGHDGQSGERGADGSPAPAPRPGLVRKEFFSQDFSLNSLKPGGPIQVQVPEGAARVLMSLDYQTGAYQDPAFTLGECHKVSPVSGTGVSANGSSVNAGGSTSRGVLYDCGALSAGSQSITWTLTGTLQGHVKLYADMPA